MDWFVMLSGCSGAGKSTLLAELAGRGFAVVEEPGRRIVREELAASGTALPWIDAAAFARKAMAVALADYLAAGQANAWVFFDRGLIDAAAALQHLTREPALDRIGSVYRYHRRVFFTPPWPEIYVGDMERRHDLEAGVTEYDRLLDVYPSLGYEVIVIPKVGVSQRADFVLRTLGESSPAN
jgi:predicted ATPase